MLKIVLFILVSQDGFIADKQGNVDELIDHDQQEDYGFNLFYQSITGILIGSKTYEQIIDSAPWPYASKKTFVFTHRANLKQEDNINFIAMPLDEFVRSIDLPNTKEKLWLMGGSQLISSFYNQHLIHQYIITIVPKTLGAGILLPKPIWHQENMHKYNMQYYYDGVVQYYCEQEI